MTNPLFRVFGFKPPGVSAPVAAAKAPPAKPPAPAPAVPEEYLSADERAGRELYARPAPRPEPPQRPMKRFEEFGLVPLCEDDAKRIVNLEPPSISDALRAEITNLDAQWQKARAFIAQHDSHSALRYAKTESARLKAAIEAGDYEAAAQVRRLARDTVMDDFSIKRRLAKAHRRELEAQAWELIKPLVAQVAASAGKMADELERQERATCKRFNRPFVPSATLAVLGQLCWRVESYIPRTAGPLAMLRFFEPSK